MKFKPLFFLYLFFYFSICYADDVDVVVAHYPPYANKNTHSGFVVDVIMESFAGQNHKVRFLFYPAKRAVHLLMQKKALLVLSRDSLTVDMKEAVNYIDVYRSVGSIIYIKDNTVMREPPYTDAKIGVYQGVEDEMQYIRNFSAKPEVYSLVDSGIKMLLKKRIDALFCIEIICRQIKEIAPELQFIVKPLGSYTWEFIIHKKASEEQIKHFEIFRKGLLAIKNNGGFLTLKEKYGL